MCCVIPAAGTYYKDPTDPRFASDKEVERFRQTMAKYAPNADAFDINYITGYNQGALLEQMLKQCKDELSRENIVRQARSIQNFPLPMAIPGIVVNTGDANSQAITELQLQRWDGKSWQLFGGVIGAARD